MDGEADEPISMPECEGALRTPSVGLIASPSPRPSPSGRGGMAGSLTALLVVFHGRAREGRFVGLEFRSATSPLPSPSFMGMAEREEI